MIDKSQILLVTYVTEEYKRVTKKSHEEVNHIFTKYGIYDFIYLQYNWLQTCDEHALVQVVTELLQERGYLNE